MGRDPGERTLAAHIQSWRCVRGAPAATQGPPPQALRDPRWVPQCEEQMSAGTRRAPVASLLAGASGSSLVQIYQGRTGTSSRTYDESTQLPGTTLTVHRKTNQKQPARQAAPVLLVLSPGSVCQRGPVGSSTVKEPDDA
ncbi:unnamed protein product [Boreogadus saida]